MTSLDASLVSLGGRARPAASGRQGGLGSASRAHRIQRLYDAVMSDLIQVAFKLSVEDLERLDGMVPDRFPSRAAALREVVHDWLERCREEQIDAALARGYADVPEEDALTSAMTETSRRALQAADLDW